MFYVDVGRLRIEHIAALCNEETFAVFAKTAKVKPQRDDVVNIHKGLPLLFYVGNVNIDPINLDPLDIDAIGVVEPILTAVRRKQSGEWYIPTNDLKNFSYRMINLCNNCFRDWGMPFHEMQVSGETIGKIMLPPAFWM
jgi:hypothetical protein